MRNILLKFLLTVLGGISIGFGIGIIVVNSLILEGIKYWLVIIVRLILGGFLMALGLMIKSRPKTEKKSASRRTPAGGRQPTEEKINPEETPKEISKE